MESTVTKLRLTKEFFWLAIYIYTTYMYISFIELYIILFAYMYTYS